MPPTADELTLARSWIGNTEEEDVFAERYDRLEDLDKAILESMRAQLSVMLFDQPSSISTPDGLSVQFTQNITALQQLIKNFVAMGGTDPATAEGGGSGVYQIERTSSR